MANWSQCRQEIYKVLTTHPGIHINIRFSRLSVEKLIFASCQQISRILWKPQEGATGKALVEKDISLKAGLDPLE